MTSVNLDRSLDRPWRRRSLVLSPGVARPLLVGFVALGAVGGALAATGAASTSAIALSGEDLTRLMRFMAGIKAVLVLGAVAAMLWRLGAPVSPGRLAVYAVAGASAAAGPGLIWGMAHVGLGALLLHGGLVASLLLLWRDPGCAALLEGALARRRAGRSAARRG